MLLGGCATKESVEHAQASADSANSAAGAARSAADRAQSSADSAAKMAQDAMTLAQQANDKVDKLSAEWDAQKNARHTRHRRHTAASAPNPAACPPNEQQKTELMKHNKAAMNANKKAPVLKTAQN
jgi:hypothetical protein